jgi:hypothetical protein
MGSDRVSYDPSCEIEVGNIDFKRPDLYALLDMNGDGRADVVKFWPQSGVPYVDVFWNTPTGWQHSADLALGASAISYDFTDGNGVHFGNVGTCYFQDVNRDGLPDAVCGTKVGINVGPAGFNQSAWKLSGMEGMELPPVPPEARTIGDVDGDGYHDVVEVHPYQGFCPFWTEGAVRKVAISSGNGYFGAAPGYINALITFLPDNTIAACNITPYRRNHLFGMADLNADGLADLVLNHDNGGATPNFLGGQLLVNTGTGWLDYDGNTTRLDGAPGAAGAVPAVPADNDPEGYAGDPTRAAVFVDLDADGVTDVAWTRIDEWGNFISDVRINTFEPAVIKRFPNGMAQKTTVSYGVITEPFANYFDTAPLDTGTTYFSAPVRVVNSSVAEDGRGQGFTSTTTYVYRSLRASATGRGPQGFRK